MNMPKEQMLNFVNVRTNDCTECILLDQSYPIQGRNAYIEWWVVHKKIHITIVGG